jgi:PAS domain S-box-containing protein
MKEGNKTKKQLVHELTELRSQNATLKKSITGSISAEFAAEEARRYAESIVETVREPLLILDADLKIISANRNFYRTFKVTPSETIGSFIYNLGNEQWDIPKLRELLEEVLPEKEAFDDFEVAHNFQDIGHKIMLLNARQIYRKDIGAKMILLAIEDITEHKRLENLLTESEERYRRLFETASDGIVLLEKREGKITHANPATEKMLGYTNKESIGNKLQDIGVLLDMGDFQTTMQNLNKSGIINYDDVPVKTKSGQHIDTDIYLVDRARLVQCNIRDITEHKLEEEALSESEARYRSLFENNHAVMLLIDPDNGAIVDANAAACAYYGWSREELERRRIDEINTLTSEEVSAEMQLARAEKRNNFFFKHRRADGTIRDVEVYSGPILLQGKTLLYSIVHDVTNRKQAEERYRSIFENAQEGIFRSTPDGRIIVSNQAMEKMFGYESPEERMTSITDLASQHHVNPEDRRKLNEMIEEYGFIKKYEAQVCRKDGSIVWISLTMHAVCDEKGQIMYCDGITEDITNRKQEVERIRKALGATVQAIAVTVETRDPYTAGHQRRLAHLARAIATEMNLPIDMIDGIHMAAAIHDIGKISVPAELLSKPTKLTAIEFSLIKIHAQTGYNILKEIDFPWPIARMVLEHHERMNGSGYPNGLTGDNLLLESRILSVADVVESMASHRPYRPTLGINAALEEIEKNRGTLYDTGTVDACLRVFREKGFQFDGT